MSQKTLKGFFKLPGFPHRFSLSSGSITILSAQSSLSQCRLIRLGACFASSRSNRFYGNICEIMSTDICDAYQLNTPFQGRWAFVLQMGLR